jgi:hypothetical protein
MTTGGVHTETKIVFEIAISMWTRSSGIKMQLWIVISCGGALSPSLRRWILTWDFSWHREEAKEDTFQKGLPIPDEAAIRERVLRKNVETPNLTTVKDFLRFHAAASKDKIKEKKITDSFNTITE